MILAILACLVFQRFFLLFDPVNSAVTTYNVGVFKPTAHDLSNSNMSNMFLALQKFILKARTKMS